VTCGHFLQHVAGFELPCAWCQVGYGVVRILGGEGVRFISVESTWQLSAYRRWFQFAQGQQVVVVMNAWVPEGYVGACPDELEDALVADLTRAGSMASGGHS